MPQIKMPKSQQDIIKNKKVLLVGLKKSLSKITKNNVIIDEEELLKAYECDALTAYKQLPLAVALPYTTQEVSVILSYCNEHEIKVVPRGAGTSLTGGAMPQADSIILGLSRLNKILSINEIDRTAHVEAGITNAAITANVAHLGLMFAPDPSSQLACTLAGNIAMNAGGAHCLKYGVTSHHILSAKLVLMNGDEVEIGGAYPEGQGFDLLGLMNGSEGQLGIIAEATVRLCPKPPDARPVLLGFKTAYDAGSCVGHILSKGIIPVAMEYMDKPAIRVSENFAHAGYPLDAEAVLIVEIEGLEEDINEQLVTIEEMAQQHNPMIIKRAENDAQSAAIWKGRKAAFGAMGQLSDYLCMDGVIPTSKLPEALQNVAIICETYQLKFANIFHAGDGNLHPVIMYDMNNHDELIRAEKCGADILKMCVALGGCLSGEHGVGIEKRDLMPVQFTQDDLDQQMALKSALDEKWLLNSAKVFPLENRPAVSSQASICEEMS